MTVAIIIEGYCDIKNNIKPFQSNFFLIHSYTLNIRSECLPKNLKTGNSKMIKMNNIM